MARGFWLRVAGGAGASPEGFLPHPEQNFAPSSFCQKWSFVWKVEALQGYLTYKETQPP